VTLVYVCAFFYGFTTRWAVPGPRMFILDYWIYMVVAFALAIQIVWREFKLARWFDCREAADAR